MLYGLRGYHTLIKEGYPSLHENFEKIGSKTCELIANSTSLGALSLGGFQQNDFPVGEGACWGFTMDWLRRCFGERYSYNQSKTGFVNENEMKAKVGKKFNQIKEQQEAQTMVKAHVKGGDNRVNLFFSQDFGDPHPTAVGGGKFAGMVMHPKVDSVNIESAQQRFYGNENHLHQEQDPFRDLQAEMHSWYMGTNYAKAQGIGWMIRLGLDDFWGGPSCGHAIGAFWTPMGIATIFDPNQGYIQAPNIHALTGEWIKKIVRLYTMRYYAVKKVVVYPVTYAPPANG